MKTKLAYFFLLLCNVITAQEVTLPIGNSGRQVFAGKLFVYGLHQTEKIINLKIYRLTEALKADSLTVEIKGRAEDYLTLYSDTLHGFLNIYLQKSKSRLVKVVRLNKNFTMHTMLEEVDITRLNSISFFEKEILYSGKNVFTIKSTVSDSAGKQFYLNKYTLKSDKENFEYDAKWQYPFERKNIQSAQIIMADKRNAYVLVNIDQGLKKGQWYLKINALEGQLIKAQKINIKGDTSSFITQIVKADSLSGTHYLFGHKFSAEEFNAAANTFNLTGRKSVTYFLTAIDSSMEIVSKNEFKVPVADIKSQANKQPSAYISKASNLKIQEEGLIVDLDVFKSLKSNANCFRYTNSISFAIINKEGVFQLQKTTISPNIQIDQFYDDSNVNGAPLLCADSLTLAFEILYKPMPGAGKIGVKKDANANYIWFLTKTNSQKNKLSLSVLAPEKKIYKLRSLTEIERNSDPFVEIFSGKEILVGKKKDVDKLQLMLFPW